MQPILDFIADHWWLVFPLIPAFGAAAAGWQRAAARRHKRRLEILQAKAQLRAAGPVTRATETQQPITRAPSAATQLERLFEAHDAVTARWLDYELDVAKLIDYPAMSDGRQPLTAAFLRARAVAQRLRPASVTDKITPDELAQYRDAVAEFEAAFDIAERDARRLKDSAFTHVERSRLATAKRLLNVAVDQAATPAERQVAYKRVREELDGLIDVSDAADEALQKKVALQLPPGARA